MSVKIGMVSLGCPKNQVDAEIMLAKFKESGYGITADAATADVIIINTCGFIESAKQESIENILEFCQLKKEGKLKLVVVTGCLAERYRDEIAEEIPEVDVVVGIGSNADIINIIEKALSGEKENSYGKKENLPLFGERVLTTLPFYAYLKIAEGCDNCCTYCAIPKIRGRFRSRPMEDIVNEAKDLCKKGVKEIILVAQDTSKYGEDLYGELKLAELIQNLCKIENLEWLRILYCYPERITDKLIEVIKTEDKVVKYIDIPMQHANGEILKKMNRKGNKQSLTELVNKLRKEIPEITIRTTFIAGFPTETQEQFEELADFVKTTKFDRLGCFAYSAEEDTIAAKMEGQIDEETKAKRADIIMSEQMFVSDSLNEKKIGTVQKVITEGFDKYGECYFGRTYADAPEIDGKVFFTASSKPKMGDFVNVKITEVMDYDLIGEEDA